MYIYFLGAPQAKKILGLQLSLPIVSPKMLYLTLPYPTLPGFKKTAGSRFKKT